MGKNEMLARCLRLACFMALALAGFGVSLITSDAQTVDAQIVLENKTSVVLDLYVDGRNACRAPASQTCSTRERVGFHTLVALATDGRSTSTSVDLKFAQVATWTISE